MIPDTPGRKDLLETAAAALREEIAPSLKGEQRLTVLMAISAIDTACRDLEVAPELDQIQAESLVGLGFEGDDPAVSLTREIRNGEFDKGAGSKSLHEVLMKDVILRCQISNPRYLMVAEDDWNNRPTD